MNPAGGPPDAAAWERLSPILDELFDLPVDRRAPRIEDACGGDAVLRRHLEALLAADAQGNLFLDSAAAAGFHGLVIDGAAEDGAAAGPEEAAGARIGPWRLLRELGRGGMGAVYLAERADGQFEQRAALKVVKLGMDTERSSVASWPRGRSSRASITPTSPGSWTAA